MGANTIPAWNSHNENRNLAGFQVVTPVASQPVAWTYTIEVAADYCMRAMYLALGILLTIIGVAAIVVPFVPATTTLLASSYFLTRSCPRLQLALNQIPLLGNFLKYLNGTRVMSRSTQRGFTIYLWGNLIATLACLHCIGLATYPIASINIVCCALSTIFLFSFRAEPAKVSQVKEAVGVALTQSTAIQPHPQNRPLLLTDALTASLSDSNPRLTHAGYNSIGLPHSAAVTDHPAP